MPADASLLSAVGLGAATVERFAHRQVLRRLDAVAAETAGWLDALASEATDAVRRDAPAAEAEAGGQVDVVVRRRIARLRLEGQDTTLDVDATEDAVGLGATFAARYEAVYGHAPAPGKPIELESLRVVASTRPPVDDEVGSCPEPGGACAAPPARRTRARLDGTWMEVAVYERATLPPGARLQTPALVCEDRSAYVIEPGWRAEVDAAGAIVAHLAQPASREAAGGRHDPAAASVVREELFTNRFAAIAEEMGQILERTAVSTNVKERLDFSCAILDADGGLLVNAPHQPVHLGALGLCVRAVRAVVTMEPGDVIVTNHPAFGGSHLPDITVITPVFADPCDAPDAPLAYVANRAHHAEIGGTRPGSMPPDATSLAEEGVVITPRHLVRRGVSRFDEIQRRLEAGPYPSRSVADNLADLRAQVAANHRGVESLLTLVRESGAAEVTAQMAALTERAARLAQRTLAGLPDGRFVAEERLDDGAPIRVCVTLDGETADFDFTGSAGPHPFNLNATPAIVRSAVIYVLRLLVGERLPLNEGLMRAVTVRVPPGILNPHFADDPREAPAVVGGNVETSQRIVDTLLKALGLAACSQGTMNNVLFGDDRFAYYETVCGGTGAGPGFDGTAAVHSHMTNTRITDPEVLEHRYPVRLVRFAVRTGSGGAGRHRGGDGVVREYEFLAPLDLSVLTQHRVERPYGMAGGEPGARGRQRIVRADDTIETLGPTGGCRVAAGDRLRLETPGGGGYGDASDA